MGQRRSIAGSRILITGASQGIGKALAEAAAARGAKVLVCAAQDRAAARSRPADPRQRRRHRNRPGRHHQSRTIAERLVEAAEQGVRRARHPRQQRRHRRHRALRRRRPRTAAPDHGSQLLRPDRNDARLSADAEEGQQAGHRQHLVHRRQARHPGPQRILRQQVRRAGLQRGARAPSWPRTASTCSSSVPA